MSSSLKTAKKCWELDEEEFELSSRLTGKPVEELKAHVEKVDKMTLSVLEIMDNCANYNEYLGIIARLIGEYADRVDDLHKPDKNYDEIAERLLQGISLVTGYTASRIVEKGATNPNEKLH